MNQFNALCVDVPDEPPIECNSQTPEVYFKYRIPTPNTISVISAIMRRINHHNIDNDYAEVCISGYPLEYTSDYIPDLDNTPIK